MYRLDICSKQHTLDMKWNVSNLSSFLLRWRGTRGSLFSSFDEDSLEARFSLEKVLQGNVKGRQFSELGRSVLQLHIWLAFLLFLLVILSALVMKILKITI